MKIVGILNKLVDSSLAEDRVSGKLKTFLQDLQEVLEGLDSVYSVRSFEEVGVLTSDEGFVLNLVGGAKIYITVQAEFGLESDDFESEEDM